jgi:GH25 family lysozyme M1 (1,4-beta-N-acetylmuramidase)
MKGIDIYSGQGTVDFSQVKASGVEIVYIKATEGLTYTDSTLNSYYSEAKAAGLKVGFYHYLRDNPPSSEAQHFLDATEGLQVDCIYMIDVEETLGQSIDQISSNVMQFADYLKSQNKEVGMYTYSSFYKENLDDTVKRLPLWIAEYGVNSPQVNNYIGWQYSNNGSINGISGNVDLDEFTESIFITNPEEANIVKYIVVYGNEVDERAAKYLADYLQCPTISITLLFDYSTVETVYTVGPGSFTSYAKKNFSGTDRFDTAQQVLDFIKAGA